MKLENNFTIDAPVEKAWQALNDPETVAPCFPGATLTAYEGDSFAGTVKVKLGPIAMTYKGKGTYVSRDEAAHEVVIEANGRDSRGNGTANATVTASLAAEGADRTAVSMITDMTITGKPAQFGRGVISDVADKIIGQFAACVARKLAPAAEDTAAVPAGGPDTVSERLPTNGAVASSPDAGASEVDAPTSTDLDPVTATGAPVTPGVGTSAVETPVSANVAPAAAPRPAAPGGGISEAEAPVSTAMDPDPETTSPVVTRSATTGGTGLRAPVRSEVDAIDLFDHAGAPVLQRLVPVLGGGLLLAVVVLLVRRLRAG